MPLSSPVSWLLVVVIEATGMRTDTWLAEGLATSSFNVGLGFNNAYGQRIFTAHSVFEPNRSEKEHVGTQVFSCEIPSFTLMPGEYSVKVWLDLKNSEADAIEEIYEPFLIQIGFLNRTPRGRIATQLAYEHFGITPNRRQSSLF